MDQELFLTPGRLIELTGITPKRLEQQLQRRGADPEATADMPQLPISAAEKGRHPRYTFTDALIVSCVLHLTRCGVEFGEALKLIKSAHLSVFCARPHSGDDLWFAAWSEVTAADRSTYRTVSGTLAEVTGRLPADRLATLSLNIDEAARQLESRLRSLGMKRLGFRLVPTEALL